MQKIKEILKKSKLLRQIVGKIKNSSYKMDFNRDKHFFLKNYLYSSSKITINKIDYEILLAVHQIEKGLSCKNLRPFGSEKVKKIIKLINIYDSLSEIKSFSYNNAINVLKVYKNTYKENNWDNKDEYLIVNDFLKTHKSDKDIVSGTFEFKYDDIKEDLNIDYLRFLKSRHSIRNFSNKKLDINDVKKGVEMAIMSPSACNRQMCKIYYITDEERKEYLRKCAQGLGLFDFEGINYFVITFDVNANYFIGEKNQGWFNSGLMTMNFVNGLHSLGIGSCCIQFGNTFKEEQKLKKMLDIPENERVAVIVVAGYYDKVSKVPCSPRKDISDILYVR